MNVFRYERGPLWTWSVMNVVRYERGPLWTWSVMNVVRYESGLLWTRLLWMDTHCNTWNLLRWLKYTTL